MLHLKEVVGGPLNSRRPISAASALVREQCSQNIGMSSVLEYICALLRMFSHGRYPTLDRKR